MYDTLEQSKIQNTLEQWFMMNAGTEWALNTLEQLCLSAQEQSEHTTRWNSYRLYAGTTIYYALEQSTTSNTLEQWFMMNAGTEWALNTLEQLCLSAQEQTDHITRWNSDIWNALEQRTHTTRWNSDVWYAGTELNTKHAGTVILDERWNRVSAQHAGTAMFVRAGTEWSHNTLEQWCVIRWNRVKQKDAGTVMCHARWNRVSAGTVSHHAGTVTSRDAGVIYTTKTSRWNSLDAGTASKCFLCNDGTVSTLEQLQSALEQR